MASGCRRSTQAACAWAGRCASSECQWLRSPTKLYLLICCPLTSRIPQCKVSCAGLRPLMGMDCPMSHQRKSSRSLILSTEHLVIANIASPTSVRNIEINPLVCVSFIDVFVQKGFKVAGTARNVPRQDAEFSRWAAPLNAKAGPRFPIHSVLVVRATAIDAILAPSYRLYAAETTEQSQVVSAMRAYGVQPSRGDA